VRGPRLRRRALSALTVVLAATGLALLPVTPASAHPLGNFTVNTADRLVMTRGGVEVEHVVDLAEIPTVQLRPTVDADRDGMLSDAELTTYAGAECLRITPLLQLTVDGAPAPLRLRGSLGQSRPGAAGLRTTRLDCRLDTAGRPLREVTFTDGAGSRRIGWKEVTATATCGSLTRSDVPADSPSQLLTAYPVDELRSPLDVRTATLEVSRRGPCVDGAGAQRSVGTTLLPRGADRLTTAFTDFVGRPDLSLPLALLAIALSVLFGALHALAPGHGKTVMAAYLVGQRGSRRQALWLGGMVTFTHTASVLLLGAVLTLGTLAAPERVVPATEVLSGLLLAALGCYLLLPAVRRLRAAPPDHEHDHDHDHDHDQAHNHEHEHAHELVGAGAPAAEHPHPYGPEPASGEHSHGGRSHVHAPLPDRPFGWRSLTTMGLAGGLVPSPSALVVLLGAAALGRAAFGAVLVLGYGLGMAVTLTVAGLLLLRAQAVITRRGWRLSRTRALGTALPALTAGVVVLVGLGLVARGIATGRGLF